MITILDVVNYYHYSPFYAPYIGCTLVYVVSTTILSHQPSLSPSINHRLHTYRSLRFLYTLFLYLPYSTMLAELSTHFSVHQPGVATYSLTLSLVALSSSSPSPSGIVHARDVLVYSLLSQIRRCCNVVMRGPSFVLGLGSDTKISCYCYIYPN